MGGSLSTAVHDATRAPLKVDDGDKAFVARPVESDDACGARPGALLRGCTVIVPKRD